MSAFWMGRREVTAREFVRYLNASGAGDSGQIQIAFQQGRHRARMGQFTRPITEVTLAVAEEYCAWLTGISGWSVRLPTELEWEYAARGGLRRAPFPWGWGDATVMACFNAAGPVPVGCYPANPFGLYDMGGNAFEWCESGAGNRSHDITVARGGSWAERFPAMLQVVSKSEFSRNYRDTDVGFRILVEAPPERK